MTFRNFIYAEDEVDLSFLPKEPSPGFGAGSSSMSINIEPLRADEEHVLQPAEVMTDSGRSPKPELFVVHHGSVAARIKDRKCKTRGGSSMPPMKRKLASGSSNSRATRAKTSTSKDDVPFLIVSDNDKGLSNVLELKDATACHPKISAITIPSWKTIWIIILTWSYWIFMTAIMLAKLLERAREEESESLRVKCKVAMSDFEKNPIVIALREKISTLSTEIASLEAEKARLEAVEVSLQKEVNDVKRDRMEVVSKVIPYAAMELIHSDDLDPSSFYIEVLTVEEELVLQEPTPSKTQALVACSPKATPSSILGSNMMSPPTDASVVKPLSSQVE
ncbi:hypothetical protein Tco_0844455 [Tanacetum coccineum]